MEIYVLLFCIVFLFVFYIKLTKLHASIIKLYDNIQKEKEREKDEEINKKKVETELVMQQRIKEKRERKEKVEKILVELTSELENEHKIYGIINKNYAGEGANGKSVLFKRTVNDKRFYFGFDEKHIMYNKVLEGKNLDKEYPSIKYATILNFIDSKLNDKENVKKALKLKIINELGAFVANQLDSTDKEEVQKKTITRGPMNKRRVLGR